MRHSAKLSLRGILLKMVDENDVERWRGLLGVLDAYTLLRVEAFAQAEEARALVTPTARFFLIKYLTR